MFEKITLFIVIIMLVASLLGILQLQLVPSVIYKIDSRKFSDWDFPALFKVRRNNEYVFRYS